MFRMNVLCALMLVPLIGCERPAPRYWDNTFAGLATALWMYDGEYGTFPHDARGSEHALYMLREVMGEECTDPSEEGFWGKGIAPFLWSRNEQKVYSCRVSYLNPSPETASKLDPKDPIFILVNSDFASLKSRIYFVDSRCMPGYIDYGKAAHPSSVTLLGTRVAEADNDKITYLPAPLTIKQRPQARNRGEQ